jgi:hypothetical protein
MTLCYQSGDEIRKGDRVTCHGEPAEIEFVVAQLVGDATLDCYVNERGPGAMVVEPKFFGRVFVSDTESNEDIVLIVRVEAANERTEN